MHSPKMLQGAPPSGGVQRWHQKEPELELELELELDLELELQQRACTPACAQGGFQQPTLVLTLPAAFKGLLSSPEKEAQEDG